MVNKLFTMIYNLFPISKYKEKIMINIKKKLKKGHVNK